MTVLMNAHSLGDSEVQWADKEDVDMYHNYDGWDLGGLYGYQSG